MELRIFCDAYPTPMLSNLSVFVQIAVLLGSSQGQHMKVTTPGMPAMFLTYLYKGVPEELGLNAKQIKELNYIMVEVGAESKDGKPYLQAHGQDSYDSYDSRVLKLLLPNQQTRFEQIWIQKVGLVVLTLPKFQKAVGLSAPQVTKVLGIFAASQAEVSSIIEKEAKIEGGKANIPPTTFEKIKKSRTEAQAKVRKELNPAQLKSWQNLQGKPFKATSVSL